MPEMSQKAKDLLTRLKAMEQQADPYMLVYRKLRDYIMPARGLFPKDGEDPAESLSTRYDNIIDATATRAAYLLASGMQGGMTSPSRPWFQLTLSDKDLAAWRTVRLWLEECQERIRLAMAQTNFYTASYQTYLDLAVFATSCQVLEEGTHWPIVHRSCPVGTFVLSEGPDGVVDTMARRFGLSHSLIKRRWKKASSEVQQLAAKPESAERLAKLIQFIYPRGDSVFSSTFGAGMPYASIYMEQGSGQILEEMGYREAAVVAPRWSTNGFTPYGEGPANHVIGDTRQLQAMQEAELEQIQLVGSPPILAPMALRGRLKLIPKGVTWGQGVASESVKAIYEAKPDLAAVSAKIQEVQTAIKQGFFNDFFLMLLERPNMTATEVLQRQQEKLILLGPVVDRNRQEFLDPQVHRYFAVMMRKGYLPKPPEELKEQDYVVEYVSTLAAAQKMADVEGLTAVAGYGMQLAQAKPDVLDVLDLDANLREYARRRNAPAATIRDKQEVEAERQGRAQAQQAQAEQAQAQAKLESLGKVAPALAGAAKDLGDTPLEGGNALAALLGNSQTQEGNPPSPPVTPEAYAYGNM